MLKAHPERFFARGQIILALCLLVCVVLAPRFFFSVDQGGVSNFGTLDQTRGWFVMGFGVATLGILLTALCLPVRTKRGYQARAGLVLLGLLYLAVTLSTFSYKSSEAARQLHEYAAITLFAAMFAGAVWLRAAGCTYCSRCKSLGLGRSAIWCGGCYAG